MAIQQKLHTKLVQKLILTPSLQQAIKLLPMSTLELSELLNQEMVENPMLEEVPTEELQPVEAAQQEKQAEQQQQKEKGVAVGPSALAVVDADRRRSDSRDRRGDYRQPR
jgi:DNA-directed RNA polymerase specialized sigma54-like protein